MPRAPLVAHKLVTDPSRPDLSRPNLSRSNRQTHPLTSHAIRTTFDITTQPAHHHLPHSSHTRSTLKPFHEFYRLAGGASATGRRQQRRPVVRRERYHAQAVDYFAHVERSPDRRGAAQEMLEQLQAAAEAAEAWQANEEEFLARAVELMRRADQARQAAGRAENERARIEGQRQREKERLRKNARARERYRQRRLIEPARFNKRTGMHALAIEVDPAAYRAVKAEAARRQTSIPAVAGEIVGDTLRSWSRSSALPASRWRRTGEGRRANQHTRIDVDDETWQALRIEALQSGRTMARWIGMALESWAQRERAVSEAAP